MRWVCVDMGILLNFVENTKIFTNEDKRSIRRMVVEFDRGREGTHRLKNQIESNREGGKGALSGMHEGVE